MFEFIKILFRGREAVMKERHERAISAIKAGAREDGMKELLALAAKGYSPAEYSLGDLCESGPEGKAVAFEWFARAARRGYARAQYRAAELYFAGAGSNTEEAEAVKWQLAAAEKGVIGAMYIAGEYYRTGRFVKKEHWTANHYYYCAAQAGHELSKKRLDEFWPYGEYREHEDDPPPAYIEYKPFWLEMIAAAAVSGCLPDGSLQLERALMSYEKDLMMMVEMETFEERDTGLKYDRLRRIFEVVFVKAYDAAFAWRLNPMILLAAEKDERLRERWFDDEYLFMPDAAAEKVCGYTFPKIALDLVNGWREKNRDDLTAQGKNFMFAIEFGLTAVIRVAFTMCLREYAPGVEALEQAKIEAANSVKYIEKSKFDPGPPGSTEPYLAESSLRTEKARGKNMIKFVRRELYKKQSDPDHFNSIELYSVPVADTFSFEEAAKVSLSFNRDSDEGRTKHHYDTDSSYYFHKVFPDGSGAKTSRSR